MKTVITTEKIPIKLWLDDIEAGALTQAKNLANLPFAYRHIAIMPDSHQGFGMPIGSILAARGVVVPNAVGVDIGCGMCALRISLEEVTAGQLKQVMSLVRKAVPVGFDWHQHDQDRTLMPEGHEELQVVGKEYHRALKQLGTLGGGNHFIEIQKGSDGFIWLMIHSGSRNLGFNVAKWYNRAAVKLNESYHSVVPKKMELAFLPLETREARDYLQEMEYCIAFALANRKLMMYRLLDAIQKVVGAFEHEEIINKSHNFAAWENHFGENVLVHRKGATRAFKDENGMIPGSQGSHSFIIRGLGNPESFRSCAHGAGRKLGRNQARKELDLEQETARLDKMGILHAVRSRQDLDEAPGSYKDIEEVMHNQQDLVEVLVRLQPLAVIKG